jgi:membrane-associated phospholipid phosphatase
MKEKSYGFRGYMLYVYLGLFAVMALVGTFLDRPIAQGIYIGPNGFSDLFEYVGTLPISVLLGSSGVLFYLFFKKRNGKHDALYAWIGLIVCVLISGGFWGFDTFHRHIVHKAWSWFLIGIPAIAVLEIPMYFFLRNGDTALYRKKAVMIIVVGVLLMFLTFGIKFLMVRPRPMYLFTLSEAEQDEMYRNWYQFNHDKTGLDGVESYMYQSWPSGHASFTAGLSLCVILAPCNKKTAGKELYFFLGALLWNVLTMLSRMLDGHHFLSDVAFGMLFGFLPPLLYAYFAQKKEEKAGEIA